MKYLKKAISTSLSTAVRAGFGSIAYPAIGKGGLGWPPNVVARTLLRSIQDTAKKETTITDIRLLVFTASEETMEVCVIL